MRTRQEQDPLELLNLNILQLHTWSGSRLPRHGSLNQAVQKCMQLTNHNLRCIDLRFFAEILRQNGNKGKEGVTEGDKYKITK
jgi:wobble nucleotide-excising tRNase